MLLIKEITLITLCLCTPSMSSEIMNTGLYRLAEFSYAVFSSFMLTDTGSISQTVETGTFRTHWVFISAFYKQSVLFVLFIIGFILMITALIFASVVICCKRNLLINADVSRIRRVCGRWVISVFFLIFIIFALFGGAMFINAVVKTKENIPTAYKLIELTVNASFAYQNVVEYEYNVGVAKVARNSARAIKIAKDANELIKEVFLNALDAELRDILNLSQIIDLQFNRIIMDLQSTMKAIVEELHSMRSHIERWRSDFLTSVSNLNKFTTVEKNQSYAIELAKLANDFPVYTSDSNKTSNTFEAISVRLDTILSKGFYAYFQTYLKKIVQASENTIYDPSELVQALKNAIFQEEDNLRQRLKKYYNLVKLIGKNNHHEDILKEIRDHKKWTIDAYNTLFPFLIIIGLLGLFLTCGLFFSFLVTLIGAKGYNNLAKSGARCLIVFCYLTLLLLWLFLCTSLFLFVASALPVDVCLETKSMGIFKYTVDNPLLSPKTNEDAKWYNMFSHKGFNLTVRSTLSQCIDDAEYFAIMPPPSKVGAYLNKVKPNITKISVALQATMFQVPKQQFEFGQAVIDNMTEILNYINVYKEAFNSARIYSEQINSTTIKQALLNIEKEPLTNPHMQGLVNTSLKFYDILTTKLELASLEQNRLTTKIQNHVDHIKTYFAEILKLHNLSKAVNFVERGPELFLKSATQVVNQNALGVGFNVNYTVFHLKNRLSICDMLVPYYNQISDFTCMTFLFPLIAAWGSSIIVLFSLLFAVVLSIFSGLFFVAPSSITHSPTPSLTDKPLPADQPLPADEPLPTDESVPTGEPIPTDEPLPSHEPAPIVEPKPKA